MIIKYIQIQHNSFVIPKRRYLFGRWKLCQLEMQWDQLSEPLLQGVQSLLFLYQAHPRRIRVCWLQLNGCWKRLHLIINLLDKFMLFVIPIVWHRYKPQLSNGNTSNLFFKDFPAIPNPCTRSYKCKILWTGNLLQWKFDYHVMLQSRFFATKSFFTKLREF